MAHQQYRDQKSLVSSKTKQYTTYTRMKIGGQEKCPQPQRPIGSAIVIVSRVCKSHEKSRSWWRSGKHLAISRQ